MSSELTLELLSQKIDALQVKIDALTRVAQSEKDKAIAKTNQRIDRLEDAFVEFLRQENINVE